MANSTARGARQVHSTNPQFLVEKVIRSRIYDNLYWKEQAFGLNATSFIDKAVALKYIGGTYGPQLPSPFLCLLLKLLQLQPDKEIILEFLNAEDFKYLRALAAMYVRLTFSALEVYELLEPLLNDYHKLRYRHQSGSYTITHMDEYIDELLTEERVCELILPRLTRRDVLEENEGLAPRISKLEDVMLHGRGALRSNGDALNGRGSDGEQSDAASDDSLQEQRKQQQRRIERAAQVRAKREAEEAEAARRLLGVHGVAVQPDVDADMEYASQESTTDEEDQNGRYVSRSPSRSVSPDRQGRDVAESGADADGDESGYVSRSPSRSPDRSAGYRSRSGSRSPDR